MSFNDISYNFNVAKVIAILMVTTGHYFGGLFWMPTTFGLFVFAFSSGFFTAKKYQLPFNKREFWLSKVSRLGYPILVIDIFLFCVFLFQEKTGIFSWQTLPSIVGMNGFFSWFNLTNTSPFGSGLWFFTLLFIFYLSYPLLCILNKKHCISVFFLLLALISTTILYYAVPMGHMLWLTVFAFIFGGYSGVYEHRVSSWIYVFIFIISLSSLMFLNLIINFNKINYMLIIISSIAMVGYLLNKRLPCFIFKKLLVISGCTIQIYFIHTYLFISFLEFNAIINYLISMVVIIMTSVILSKVSNKLIDAVRFRSLHVSFDK